VELRSRAEIRGVLKIRVADVERAAYFTEVTYGGV